MKKILVIILIITLSLFMASCGKSGGQWVLVDTEFNEEEWQAELEESNDRDGFYQSDAEVSEGSFTWIYSYIGKDGSDKQAHAFPGNSVTTEGSWTEPNKNVVGPDFQVSMRINIEVVDRHPDHPLQAGTYLAAEVPIPMDDGGVLHGYLSDDNGESSFYPSLENDLAPIDAIIYGTMEKGETEGEKRALEVRLGGGSPLMSYIYQWQE